MLVLSKRTTDFFRSKTLRQTSILYASYILQLLVGIGSVTINTRLLGPEEYGLLSFFLTVTLFVGIFFNFGFFNSGGILIIDESRTEQQREIIGALVILSIGLGIAYSSFIWLSSFFIDKLFNTSASQLFRRFYPLLAVAPMQILVYQAAMGTNRILLLSVFNILPKILYVSSIGLMVLLGQKKFSLETLILLSLITNLAGTIIIIIALAPSFSNAKSWMKRIWSKNREYGFHMFLGQITDKSTYKLDGILIPFFANTVELGFYNLGATITGPILLLSQSLSTSIFRRFAHEKRVPSTVTLPNLCWLIISTLALCLCSKFLISILFGDKYAAINSLIIPLALTRVFQGLYQPYNCFLSAKEQGKWLRNISVAQAAFNVVGNLLLIYYLAALGAAIASMIAAAIALAGHLYYYRRFLKNNMIIESAPKSARDRR
jgi:O-antigen/teichoic acid export membrane protein